MSRRTLKHQVAPEFLESRNLLAADLVAEIDIPAAQRMLESSGHHRTESGQLYFVEWLGPGRQELWRSDGTAAGTNLVREFQYVPIENYVFGDQSGISSLQASGDSAFFVFRPSPAEQFELHEVWRVNGDSVAELFFTGPHQYAGLGDVASADNVAVIGLWNTGESDFWSHNSVRVVNSGGEILERVGGWVDVSNVTATDDAMYWVGRVSESNGIPESYFTGASLCRFAAGDLNCFRISTNQGEFGQGPTIDYQLTPISDRAIYLASASDSPSGTTTSTEIWAIAESDADAQLVASFPYDALAEDGAPQIPRIIGGLEDRALFTQNGTLWVTDGTAASTREISSFTETISDSLHVERIDDSLFFPIGNRLWRSDGTDEGTFIVKEFPRQIGDVIAFDGELLFAADDGIHGRELWVSDGTADGTRLEADINPGTLSSSPSGFVAAVDRVFFEASPVFAREAYSYQSDRMPETQFRSDINQDGHVDFADFLLMRQKYNMAADRDEGDLDGDGRVSLLDFEILRSEFGRKLNS